jgi:hypothetical protein
MEAMSAGGNERDRELTDLLVADDTVTPVPLLVAAAGLLLAVAIIHLQDQGGLLGGESPTWLKYGYYLIEIGSLVSALLVIRGKVIGWILGLAFTIGPFTGYILSRSVGVPGDQGDVGNWGYLLGTVSLIVEGSFVILAAACVTRLYRARPDGTLEGGQRVITYRERERQNA